MPTPTVTATTHPDHVACRVEIAGVSWTFVTYAAEVRTGRTFAVREVVALHAGSSKAAGYQQARAAAIVWLRREAAAHRIAALGAQETA
jgi:hypothetical protein